MESPDPHPDLLLTGELLQRAEDGDLVLETLLRAIEGLGSIQVRGPGVFRACVRQAMLNPIRDQVPVMPDPHARSVHADPRRSAFLERMGLEPDQ